MSAPNEVNNLTNQQNKKELVISYLLLRRLIGILGISLPFMLILGAGLFSNARWLQASISHYYFSVMHISFVGVLCLLCGFLVCYRGQVKQENNLSTLAGFFALSVATFPTDCKGFLGSQYFFVPAWKNWYEWVHYGSAACLFICFAIFCFKIFHESDDEKTPDLFDDKKKRRNSFYSSCGYIIAISIGCIGAIAVYKLVTGSSPEFTKYTTFIFETTSLLAFGSSWLLKGTYGLPPMKSHAQKVMNYFR